MQTKKRAKPVKFGKAAKTERKETEPAEEPKKVVKTEITEDIISHEADDHQPPHETTKKVHIETRSEVIEDDTPEEPIEKKEKHEIVEEEAFQPDETHVEVVGDEDKQESNVVQEAKEMLESSSDVDKEPQQVEEEPEEVPLIEKEPERIVPRYEDSPFDSDLPPVETEKKKNLFVYFIIIVFVTFVFGLAFIVGAYYALQNKNISLSEVPQLFTLGEPTPAPELTKKPSPTATPKPVDLSAYTIKVLNGSGITGEAAKLKTALIDEGFKVTSTGNADLSDYTKTQVVVNDNVDDAFVEKLEEFLGETYSVSSSAPAGSTSQGADVTITIGSQKAN